MGMAGAFGALGGDVSAISQNPGGIGIYRSSELSITPVFSFSKTSSDFNGTLRDDNKMSIQLNSIGYVGVFRPTNDANINNINIGITYNKIKDYNRNVLIVGKDRTTSLLDMICNDNQNTAPDGLNGLGLMAYEAFLTDYSNGNYTPQLLPNELVDSRMYLNEEGYEGAFDFTLGANWGNFMYMGASLGLHTVNYRMTSSYKEDSHGLDDGTTVWDPISFEVLNALTTTGTGVNLKLGAILKPFSFLRFGFALHSATYYTLTDAFGSSIFSSFLEGGYSFDEEQASYELRSPGKIMYSVAYLFGKKGILSFDCDVIDYRGITLKDENGLPYDDINLDIDNHMNTVYNLRFGGEYRLTESISLRGGIALNESAYKELLAENNTYVYAVGTNPSYSFDTGSVLYTGGLGYRSGAFSIDAALTCQNSGEAFFNYYDAPVTGENRTDSRYTELTTSRINLAVTAGIRF